MSGQPWDDGKHQYHSHQYPAVYLPWAEQMPTQIPFTTRPAINIAILQDELVMLDPNIQTTDPAMMAFFRPNRSAMTPDAREAIHEPAGIAAVIPPWVEV